jgi:hypothetical protein
MNVQENEDAVFNTNVSLGISYKNSPGNIRKYRRTPINVKKPIQWSTGKFK